MQAVDHLLDSAGGNEVGVLVPRLADGVALLGAYDSPGLRNPRFLARRGDGQTVLLSELLYQVLERVDGRRSLEGIAEELSRCQERPLGADAVAYLIRKKLGPLGLVGNGASAGTAVAAPRANPILSLAARRTLMPARTVGVVASVFAPLFFPPVIVVVLLGLVASDVWLVTTNRLGPAFTQIGAHPAMLVVVLGLLGASTLFHEWGHATACKYGGARPGAIGMGIYLLFPAFYTNVTDSYRLNRRGRVRTDLGGVYFNAVFIGVAAVGFALTGYAPLALIIVVTHIEMTQQLLPVVRFDGYFVLADLVGVPDLFARIRPILVSLVRRSPHPQVAELTRRTRIIVRAWVLVVVPLLATSLTLLLVRMPHFIRGEWRTGQADWHRLTAIHSSQWSNAVLAGVSLVILVVPVVGLSVLVVRSASRASRLLRRGTRNDMKTHTTTSPVWPDPSAGDPSSQPAGDSEDVLPERVSAGRRLARGLKAVLERSPATAPEIAQFAKPTVPSAGKRYRQAIQATNRAHNLERMVREARLGRCMVIAVVSPKGGAGKTTITALLGMLFAELRRDPVLALDANPDFGNLKDKLARSSEAVTTTDELAAWLEDEAVVTPARLSARLGVGPHGLRFLPSPVEDLKRMVKAADVDLYRQLLARLRDYQGIIVVDCGTGLLDPPVRATLETADQILLVTDSAADTARLVVAAANHLPSTPTWLVANKMPSRGATVDLDLVQEATPQLRGVTIIREQRLTENIITPESPGRTPQPPGRSR